MSELYMCIGFTSIFMFFWLASDYDFLSPNRIWGGGVIMISLHLLGYVGVGGGGELIE